MGVYFYYRCPYEAPAGGYLKRFEGDDTVLDWFRSRWHRLGSPDRDEVYDRVEKEMGRYVYGFASLFAEAVEQSWPPPSSAKELGGHVEGACYNNNTLCDSPHLLQVDTDDDEYGLAYYFFDDHYLARHGKRAAFLLRGDWRLPGGAGPPGFRPAEKTSRVKPRGPGEGTTYLIDLDSVGDMEDLCDGQRVEGVRLPELMKYLARTTPEHEGGDLLEFPRAMLTVAPPRAHRLEVAFLRAIREDPHDEAAWAAYSDWLQERGEMPVGLHTLRRALTWLGCWYDEDDEDEGKKGKKRAQAARPSVEWPEDGNLAGVARWMEPFIPDLHRRTKKSRSLVHVQEHVAQMCLHDHYWPGGNRHIYHEWIYFDDLWAGAQPDLANAILRHVRRWDVLSTSRTAPT